VKEFKLSEAALPMTTDRQNLKTALTKEVLQKPVPRHVAIIMDGNGRWAKEKGRTRIKGHQEGARQVKKIVRFADDLGVRFVTLYAFSVENWARPSFEVSALMRLIRTYIVRERDELHAEGVRFRLVGRLDELAPEIQRQAEISAKLMEKNTGLTLSLCINYGGRAEIIDGVKRMIREGLPPERITEDLMHDYLYAPDVPDPDLIVRTSGEMRLSNFLLWQSAYAELYVTPVFWPDFDDVEFLKAIKVYQDRERRFGKTGAQITANST